MSIVMIICSAPMNVVAEAEEPTEVESNEIVSDHIELEAEEEVARITEIESLREENVKHFQLPDGTYEMIVYGEAVHRKDTFGKWQDINNNLTLTDVKTESLYASSDMRTVFAQSYRADKPLMTLSENGYSISMSLVADTIDSGAELMSISEPIAPAVQNATLRDKDIGFETISQAAEIDNRSSIKYQNVKTNVDIEYVMSGNDIKENIIVKARGTSYVYRFDLALTGLTPELSNNTVILKDHLTDEIKYVIPEPYMYDANGNLSYDVTYSLIDRGLGTYRLTVTADATWINAEGRAFPVTVDPTMHPVVLEDTYISQSAPNTKYHTSTSLAVSSTQTAFLIAGLPLPDNALVNTAYLNVSYYYSGNVTSGSTTVGVYGVNDEWSESTLTYNTSSDIQIGTKYDQLTLSGTEGATAANPNQVSFDITYLADIWSVGTSNNGVALKYVSHVSNPTVYFVSSNATTNRPSINVNYTYRISNGGVFGIENLGTPNKWLTVASAESQYLTATTSDVSPLDASPYWDFSRLFKITRHANMSSYIIRSMVDNCLSIQPETDESGNVYWKIVEIDADDANVPASQTFYFQFDGNFGGYRIYPYGDSGNMIHYTSNGSVLGEGPANAASSWSLAKYVGEDKNDYVIVGANGWNTTGAIINTEYMVNIMGYSTMPNINRVEYSISDTSQQVVTYNWDSNAKAWKFTPISVGAFYFTFKYYNGNSTTPQTSKIMNCAATYSNISYIQHSLTEMYIDIERYDNGYVVDDDGARIIQNKYSEENSQQWIIEPAPSYYPYFAGYVTIRSQETGRYIGVDYDDHTIIRQYGYIDDFTVWSIDKTPNGTYTLECYVTSTMNHALAISSDEDGEGAGLVQVTYDNPSERYEWYIVGKVISMVNYYDSTFAADSALVGYIDDAVSFANTIYSKYFGIGFYIDGNPLFRSDAIADTCSQHDKNAPCTEATCGSNHANHHKNIVKIANQLNYNREDDHIYIMWAHREYNDGVIKSSYCKLDNNKNHIYAQVLGGVPKDESDGLCLPIITVLKILGAEETKKKCMSLILAHEITHCLQMEDVYYDGLHYDGSYAIYTCFMDGMCNDSFTINSFYNNVLNGNTMPFCGACMIKMKRLSYNYINNLQPINGND